MVNQGGGGKRWGFYRTNKIFWGGLNRLEQITKSKSRFPAGMTKRKTRAKAKAKADSLRE
ncbi:MAG TPA: hypothetical protein VMU71_04305 [Terracidiphilus sp.]|nr:hypothetical protein [Terracidiphilus sp.]